MSERIKFLFVQFLMIATGIIGVMSLEGIFYHFKGGTFSLKWYHPASVIIAAFFCSIPSMFLLDHDEWSRKKYITRIIIHTVVLYAIVAGMGYIFNWYSELSGFICLTIGYFLVYAFVWISSLWIGKREANKINAALDNIRDEE